MTIEDLKTLMDNFDPAALLPEIDTVIGRIELLMRISVLAGPIILLVLGILYTIAAPREANYHFGYRCYFGMGSVEAWRFTQRLAGIVWGVLGLALTVGLFFISSGFRGQEVVSMLSSAFTCVLWEAGLIIAACLAINILVAIRYDSKGQRRSTAK